MSLTISAGPAADRMADRTLANLEKIAAGSPIDTYLDANPETKERFEQVGRSKRRPPMTSTKDMRPAPQAVQPPKTNTGPALEKYRGGYRGLIPITHFKVKELQPVDYLYAGLGAIVFSGPNDVGKSSVTERLGARVLLGTTDGIWKGEPHGVLFVLSEDDPGMVRQAMKAQGVTDFIMERKLFVYVTADNDKVEEGDYDVVTLPDDVPWLMEQCAKHDIRLVVFDAVVDCMPGVNLNDRADVSRVFKPLNKWGAESNILVVLVHHNTKGRDGTAKQAVSGSAAFTDKPRIVVSLDKDQKDGTRVMQLVKVKGRSDNPSFTYDFETREIEIGEGKRKPVGIVTKITPTDTSVDDIRNKNAAEADADKPERTSNNEVIDWLVDWLSENGPHRFEDIQTAAAELGYDKKQLSNARQRAKRPWIASVPDPEWKGKGVKRVWSILETDPAND